MTGATSGIGQAIAIRLAQEACNIAIESGVLVSLREW
ncbi:MAG: hypothetical protein ACYTX0_61970, partial [Nostoc sp.]